MDEQCPPIFSPFQFFNNEKDEFPFSAFLGLSRPFSVFLGLFVLISLSVAELATAQRLDRPNLNDMPVPDRETLAQLIDEWITEDMNTEHGQFFEDIHTTNNFLPWHRMHIRDLEDYINTVNPTLLPTGLLPYYNPAE